MGQALLIDISGKVFSFQASAFNLGIIAASHNWGLSGSGRSRQAKGQRVK